MKNSKTLKLLMELLKEAKDPTEVSDNADEVDVDAEVDDPVEELEADEPEPTIPLTSEGEKFLIRLLVKAFAHTPDTDELKIIDTVNLEFQDENPKQIADTIAQLLDTSDSEEFTDILDIT